MVLDFAKSGGLVPAVVQDSTAGEVLMVGYMNREAVRVTLETGLVAFFSRSRGKLWVKGESSGHYLGLEELLVDCDADALVVRVRAAGPGTCHLGYRSCFFRRLTADGALATLAAPKFDPATVYPEGSA